MANRKNVSDQPVEELQGSSGDPSAQLVEEFDPDAPLGDAEATLESSAAAGTIETDDGWLAARDELEAKLGSAATFLAALSQAASPDSLGRENIQAIGIGVRKSGGTYTGETAVKVFVQEKAPLSRIDSSVVIPEEVGGYPTDVEEIGEIHAQVYKARYPRPVPCGVSCGHVAITAGTIGCLVVLNNNRLCILSNNHVLANENNARIGDPIIQPGRYDGGTMPGDRIAVLERFVPITFSGVNLVDAAAGWTSFSLVKPQHVTYRMNPRPLASTLSLSVMKNGRTTQATQGLIIAHHVNNVRVGYGSGVALFNDQIVIRGIGPSPFSQGGDSGSVIVSTGTKQPVGLLFAGSSTHTIANPIVAVMRQLGIARFLGG